MRIPDELPLPQAETRPMIAVVTAVAMLLGVNIVLIVAGVTHPPQYTEYLLQEKWELARDREHSFDWLVVGDSSGTLGVDPELLSAELGKSFINLCTVGSMGLVDNVWLVDEYLKTHKAPQGVIVVHAADVWLGNESESLFQYAAAQPEPATSMLMRLVDIGGLPGDLFRALHYRDWFPVLQLKDRLRDSLGWSVNTQGSSVPLNLPLNGRKLLEAARVDSDRVVDHSRTYWDLIDASRKSIGSLLPQSSDNNFGSYGLNRQDRRSLSKLIERAENIGFSLCIANGPISSLVRQDRLFDARMNSVQSKFSAIASSHVNVEYLLTDWIAFSPEQMENANHIVGDAVAVYTRLLASAVQSVVKNSDATHRVKTITDRIIE